MRSRCSSPGCWRSAGVAPCRACFALGSLAFCAGVWLRALTDTSLGPITPAGGMVLLLGWVLLAFGALARDR